MGWLVPFSLFLLVISLVALFLPFLYPFLLLPFYRKERGKAGGLGNNCSVSIIIPVRNGEDVIVRKLENILGLDYPLDRREIIVASDGSTDRTEELVEPYLSMGVTLFSSAEHQGKYSVLNRAAGESHGEILVFSDVDAVLDKESLSRLLSHFTDPRVGGVCGAKVISKEGLPLVAAQRTYNDFAGWIKELESRTGNISSNDGTLHAVRRELFDPIPPGVTDDLYVCLTVARKGRQFLFEPRARAFISIPSRSGAHEIIRRRRIVSRSLRGIYLMKELLNPRAYGLFSLGLLVNKVLRRLMPVFLLLIFLSTMVLARRHALMKVFIIAQAAFYLSALLYVLLRRLCPAGINKAFFKPLSLVYYFCLGNYGTLLGLLDFMRGKSITKWEPLEG